MTTHHTLFKPYSISNELTLKNRIVMAPMTQFLRTYYHGTLIASGGYQLSTAQHAIDNEQFDLVAMGRPFIANPDLVQRLLTDQPLQNYDKKMLETLY